MIEWDELVMCAVFILIHFLARVNMYYWNKQGLSKGFEEVKDLIRGTIVAELPMLFVSYQHFKSMPGVKILEIKSLKKIEQLQNITVIFEYKQTFIGEMQFRFGNKPANY